MSVLVSHMAALRYAFVQEQGRNPEGLAVGRWDARELARVAGECLHPPVSPRQMLRAARGGAEMFGVPVRLDGRIGRMPGALFWH